MSERDRRTILLGSLFLGGVLIAWFAILPWWASWNQTQERIEQSQGQFEEFQSRAQRLISMDRQLQPILGDAVKAPLPNLDDARRELVKSVSNLYAQSGAEIQTFQPQAERPVTELPGVTRLSVQVQCSCQPMQLVKLMADAKSSSMLLLLDQVDMTSAARGGGGFGGGNTVTMVWSALAAQNGSRP